ncbi:MAG: molecular chaperone [Ramlibacter sp.]|nr:molecular chaperone [Ramlibacter sp.]
MTTSKLPPRSLVAASLLLLGMTPALAGVFSVTPVRIFMKPRDRAVAVTLVNEGDTEVALQADINHWTQKPDGTDELVLTEDMILSPPIIKLAPRARQVVRLALLKPADASRQLTYRMVVREVPEAVAPKGNTMEVPIALALSMPVFITPPTAARDLSCEAVRPDAQTLQAVCRNGGSAYAQIREIQLRRGGQVLARFEGGNYLLPGVRKAIGLKATEPVPAGPAELGVVFDDFKTQAFQVTLP